MKPAKTLSFAYLPLSTFPTIPPTSAIHRLDVSNTPLPSLDGMAEYSELQHFLAANTKLISFKGACRQHNLTEINFQGTPLGSEQFFNIMALVVFGDSLVTINSQTVTENQRRLSASLPPEIRGFLVKGWLLKRINLPTLLNPETRQRKTIYRTPPRAPRAPKSPPVTARELQETEVFEEEPVTFPLKYDDLRPSDVQVRVRRYRTMTAAGNRTVKLLGALGKRARSPGTFRPPSPNRTH